MRTRTKTMCFRGVDGDQVLVRSLGTRDKREAERILKDSVGLATAATKKAEIMVSIATQRGLASQAGKTLINDSLECFLKTRKPNAHRLKTISNSWRIFAGWMEEKYPAVQTIGEITSDHVGMFIVAQMSVKAESTTALIESAIRQILTSLLKHESPLTGKKKTARLIPVKERRELTDSELNAITETAGFDTDEAIAVKLGMTSGARLGDVFTARWEDFDLKAGLWAYTPEKTKRAQKNKAMAPLSKNIVDILNSRQRSGIFVFPCLESIYHKSANAASATMRNIFIRAGLTGNLVGFHTLRTTYATRAVKAGVPVSTLGRILCDAPSTLLAFYTKTDISSIDDARDKMAANAQPDEAETIRRDIRAKLDDVADVEALRKARQALGI